MIHRILLFCLPYSSLGLLAVDELTEVAGASGREDFPPAVVVVGGGSWLCKTLGSEAWASEASVSEASGGATLVAGETPSKPEGAAPSRYRARYGSRAPAGSC